MRTQTIIWNQSGTYMIESVYFTEYGNFNPLIVQIGVTYLKKYG